jgi:hypothetical protein
MSARCPPSLRRVIREAERVEMLSLPSRSRDFHSQQKVNSTRSIWQQTMKRKSVRILVAVLASFALFAFACPDGLSENDPPYSQSVSSKEFSVKIPAHRNEQSRSVDPHRLSASNKSKCFPRSSGKIISPIALSLAACVLRC